MFCERRRYAAFFLEDGKNSFLEGQNKIGGNAIKVKSLRINGGIEAPRLRVVGEKGNQLGILSRAEALKKARDLSLDLVEVAPAADPPVCKIMDYGKYRFELKKKEKNNKKKSRPVVVKEISFRPRIDDYDLGHKLKFLRKFLEMGNKVKISIRFRGREQKYPSLGKDLIKRVGEKVFDLGLVDRDPKMEGRNMIVYINPISMIKKGGTQDAKDKDK